LLCGFNVPITGLNLHKMKGLGQCFQTFRPFVKIRITMFLPRDAIAMLKRGLCRHAVTAGWLAVTLVYCVETAKDIRP